MQQSLPFFSIIVPTYQRPQLLMACLQALAKVDYPHSRFEVIVVDDGSESSSEAVVSNFAGQLSLVFERQPNAGPATARNLGAARAKGQFLAFTDDDCLPAPDWLKTLAARFAQTPEAAVGGRTVNALSRNPYSTASQLLIEYLYAYYNTDPHQARFLTSNNLAVPAATLRAIGGFSAAYRRAAAEDRELCDRWISHGFRLVYAPEAVVYHAHALTLRTFCRQHFGYGRGAFHFHHARALKKQTPLKIEPLTFYLNLLRYPVFRRRGGPAIVMLLLMTQGANALGYFWEKETSRFKRKFRKSA